MRQRRADEHVRLMCRVQTNDTEAFAELYDRLAPRALGLAKVLCGDFHRAEEIVQDSFVDLWRARGQYHPDRAPVIAWLFGIVRNRTIDARRREARHVHTRQDAEPVFDKLEAPDHVEAEVLAADVASQLRARLASLPCEQREVIALAYYGYLTHTEIAKQLAVPLGTVKGRMRLALIKLREDPALSRSRATLLLEGM